MADVVPDRVRWCAGVGCEDIGTNEVDYTDTRPEYPGQKLFIPLCDTCLRLANTDSGIETETTFFVKLSIGAAVEDLFRKTKDVHTTVCSSCGGTGTQHV